jgi:hypothetical protein
MYRAHVAREQKRGGGKQDDGDGAEGEVEWDGEGGEWAKAEGRQCDELGLDCAGDVETQCSREIPVQAPILYITQLISI